jgi:hypothetical protein
MRPWQDGVSVHANSWGCSDPDGYFHQYCNRYDYDDSEMDKFIFDHPNMLVVTSAGNDGRNAEYGTLGSPGTCKNLITVGASSNTFEAGDMYYDHTWYDSPNPSSWHHDVLADFSSTGPTFDQRIKPDIVAPGKFIISAEKNTVEGTSKKQGTSMSCPVVAGNAALIYQYFLDGFYPSRSATPADSISASASLVKAVLINSAIPLRSKQKMPRPFNYPQAPVIPASYVKKNATDADGRISVVVKKDTFEDYWSRKHDTGCKELTFDPEAYPVGTCTDTAGFLDESGYSCGTYWNSHFCKFYGGGLDPVLGVTAREACCLCGGGAYTEEVHVIAYSALEGDVDIEVHEKANTNYPLFESYNYSPEKDAVRIPLHMINDVYVEVCFKERSEPFILGIIKDKDAEILSAPPTLTCATAFQDIQDSVVKCPTNCVGGFSGTANYYTQESSVCAAARDSGVVWDRNGAEALNLVPSANALDDGTVYMEAFYETNKYVFTNWEDAAFLTDTFYSAFWPVSNSGSDVSGYTGYMYRFPYTVDHTMSVGEIEVTYDHSDTSRPNYASGFGRMMLANSLPLASDTVDREMMVLRDDLSKDDRVFDSTVATYDITFAANDVTELVVTLVWTDPPVSSLAQFTVAHDLNLKLTLSNCVNGGEEGAIFYGNGFDTAFDSVNNVEQIRLEYFTTCTDGQVEVHGYAIASTEGQDYSLIVRGYVDSSVDPIAVTPPCNIPGFTGEKCEVDIDDCASNPCQNTGVCSDLGVQAYSCNCLGTGFDGDNCEVQINDCLSNPCENGGVCADGLNLFTCDCSGTIDFEGDTCAETIDDCAAPATVCVNGGLCVDGDRSNTCDCSGTTDFEGTT